MSFFFFFNDTATTEIYTLSLHDALPIFSGFIRPSTSFCPERAAKNCCCNRGSWRKSISSGARSEEHTSELQSRQYLVCRLLLEKKTLLLLRDDGSPFLRHVDLELRQTIA